MSSNTYTESLCEEGFVADRRKGYDHDHWEEARDGDDIASLEDCRNLWLDLVDLTIKCKQVHNIELFFFK